MSKLMRRNHFKVAVICLLLAAFTLSFAACGSNNGANAQTPPAVNNGAAADAPTSAEPGSVQSSKDTLVIRLASDPGTIDFAYGEITESLQLFSLVGTRLLPTMLTEDGLYVTGPNDKYSLAVESIVDDDNLGMTFKLREGVKWQNGDDFTAEDVAYSIQRYSGIKSWQEWCDFENVKVINDYEIDVRFTKPFALAETTLGAMFICNHNTTDPDDPLTVSKNYVGTGAWKIVEWIEGDHITLERFDGHFAGVAPIKTIIIRFIQDASVAMMELETGGVDLVDQPNWPSVKGVLEGSYGDTIAHSSSCDIMARQLWFNSQPGKPFNDIRVRKAVMYALDRDAINYGAFEGLGDTPYTVYSRTMEGAVVLDPWPIEYNIEKAKELMKEAGYENGFDAVILNTGAAEQVLANEIIANQLKEIGINLTIESFDTPTWISVLTEQPEAWDLTIRGYGGAFSPGRWFDTQFKVMCHITAENDPAYAELEATAREILQTLDYDKRIELTEGIQKVYFDKWAYTYPIQQITQHILLAGNLKGVVRAGYYWFMLDAYFE